MNPKAPTVETCAVCGHKGPRGNSHDCYWVLREKLYPKRPLSASSVPPPVKQNRTKP